MFEILISALAEAILTVVIEDLSKRPAISQFRARISGSSQEKIALEEALKVSIDVFQNTYPDLASSLLDESFFLKAAIITELSKLLTPDQWPEIITIQDLWYKQYSNPPKIDVTTEIDFFINRLNQEIKSKPSLRPFVDSRALQELYSISKVNQDQLSVLEDIRNSISNIEVETKKQTTKELSGNLEISKDATQDYSELINRRGVIPILYQLPSPPKDFIGREHEIEDLLNSIRINRESIIGIFGAGGVGKTSLALKLAEILKTDYPSGQIYINFDGMSENFLSAFEATKYIIT